MAFPLPHHPSLTSIDPLGICDESETDAAFQGEILDKLLASARTDLSAILAPEGGPNATSRDADTIRQAFSKRFTSLIQDIAYSLHNDGDLKTTALHHHLVDTASLSLPDLSAFTARLLSAAANLSTLFPCHELPYLTPTDPRCTLTLAQIDTLLAHLFLGTLQQAPGTSWGRPGFAEQLFGAPRETYPQAGEYVRVLVQHFVGGGYASATAQTNSSTSLTPEGAVTFTLSTSSILPSSLSTSTLSAPRIPVTFVPEPSEPSTASSDGSTFVLVAAHSQPGPGPSCTQEERLVSGQSPALAIVSLLVPVIPADAAVITCPLPVHAMWRGHGRHGRLVRLLGGKERVRRGYVVADAMEMDERDEEDMLPDLREGIVEREVRKLVAAFQGTKEGWEGFMVDDRTPLRIEIPPWGCGAFGGNLKVKMRCMQIAAGLVGLKEENLVLFVPEGLEWQVLQHDPNVRTVGEIFTKLKRSEF